MLWSGRTAGQQLHFTVITSCYLFAAAKIVSVQVSQSTHQPRLVTHSNSQSVSSRLVSSSFETIHTVSVSVCYKVCNITILFTKFTTCFSCCRFFLFFSVKQLHANFEKRIRRGTAQHGARSTCDVHCPPA